MKNFKINLKLKLTYLHYFQLIIAAIPPDFETKDTRFGSTVPDLLGATLEFSQMEDRPITIIPL